MKFIPYSLAFFLLMGCLSGPGPETPFPLAGSWTQTSIRETGAGREKQVLTYRFGANRSLTIIWEEYREDSAGSWMPFARQEFGTKGYLPDAQNPEFIRLEYPFMDGTRPVTVHEYRRCVVSGDTMTVDQAFLATGNSATLVGKWKSPVAPENILDVHVEKLFYSFEITADSQFVAERLGYSVPVTLQEGSMIVHDSDYVGDIGMRYRRIGNTLYFHNPQNPAKLLKMRGG